MPVIDIGQKMRFIPYYLIGGNDTSAERAGKMVTGKVIYVDRAHKKFTVKYPWGDSTMKETFKFSQIGQDIKII